MSKTIKISAEFIQEMKLACDEKQLKILKQHVDAWDYTITEQGVKELYSVACEGWKTKFEAQFPEVLKANNPCSEINGLPDVYKKLNCDPSKDKVYIDGFNEEQTNVLLAVARNMRICEAYNGKKKLSITDRRYYDWYVKNSAGAGLVFVNSDFNDDHAYLTSAACLSLAKKEYLDDARKKFPTRTTDILGF